MARQKHRSIDAPPHQDEEPNWKDIAKADAVREASKLLGCERSAIKVIRFLEQRGVQVTSPQAVKVLGDLYRKNEPPPPTLETLAISVKAVLAVQQYAAEHGGAKALAKKLQEAESLFALAESIGGLDVLRAILQQLSTCAG